MKHFTVLSHEHGHIWLKFELLLFNESGSGSSYNLHRNQKGGSGSRLRLRQKGRSRAGPAPQHCCKVQNSLFIYSLYYQQNYLNISAYYHVIFFSQPLPNQTANALCIAHNLILPDYPIKVSAGLSLLKAIILGISEHLSLVEYNLHIGRC